MKNARLLSRVTWFLVFALALGCSPISYKTIHRWQADPTFDFAGKNRVWFVSNYNHPTARAAGVTEIGEKHMFGILRDALRTRGYELKYLPDSMIIRREKEFYPRPEVAEQADFCLNLVYIEVPGYVDIPAQSSGWFSWNDLIKGGAYSSTPGQRVQIWNLMIGADLWAIPPKFVSLVWHGELLQGSPKPDLFERAPVMIDQLLLRNKFPDTK